MGELYWPAPTHAKMRSATNNLAKALSRHVHNIEIREATS